MAFFCFQGRCGTVSVSQAWKVKQTDRLAPEGFVEIRYWMTDSGAQEKATAGDSSHAYFSNTAQITDTECSIMLLFIMIRWKSIGRFALRTTILQSLTKTIKRNIPTCTDIETIHRFIPLKSPSTRFTIALLCGGIAFLAALCSPGFRFAVSATMVSVFC